MIFLGVFLELQFCFVLEEKLFDWLYFSILENVKEDLGIVILFLEGFQIIMVLFNLWLYRYVEFFRFDL